MHPGDTEGAPAYPFSSSLLLFRPRGLPSGGLLGKRNPYSQEWKTLVKRWTPHFLQVPDWSHCKCLHLGVERQGLCFQCERACKLPPFLPALACSLLSGLRLDLRETSTFHSQPRGSHRFCSLPFLVQGEKHFFLYFEWLLTFCLIFFCINQISNGSAELFFSSVWGI